MTQDAYETLDQEGYSYEDADDLLERLDTMEQGATLHFNPPVPMFVMKSRTNFSHVVCPVVD